MRRWRRAGVGVRGAVRVPAAGRDRRRARHLPGARRERGGRGTEGASQSESERLREGGRKKHTLATCPELAVRSSPSFARGVTTTESALPNRRRWWEARPPIIVTPLPAVGKHSRRIRRLCAVAGAIAVRIISAASPPPPALPPRLPPPPPPRWLRSDRPGPRPQASAQPAVPPPPPPPPPGHEGWPDGDGGGGGGGGEGGGGGKGLFLSLYRYPSPLAHDGSAQF